MPNLTKSAAEINYAGYSPAIFIRFDLRVHQRHIPGSLYLYVAARGISEPLAT